MVSREDVAAAYRIAFGREPEAEEIIDFHVDAHDTIAELRETLIGSEEFLRSSLSLGSVLHSLAFRLAYDRLPSRVEMNEVMRCAASAGARKSSEVLRAAVSAFSRQSHPTPVTVRLTERDLDIIDVTTSPYRLTLDRFDHSVSGPIIAHRDYEGHLGRFVRSIVRPGMTCIDVGANVGFHTFLMRSVVGETGHVYAVEPNSENCRMLLLAIRINAVENVTVLPVALSNQLGAVPFSPAIGSNGSFMYGVGDPLMHPNCIVVPTVRLDDLIRPERLDFIKIDVEGAEPLALAGAARLIATHRPVITSEFSDAMIKGVSGISGEAYLHQIMSAGYRAYTLGLSGPMEEIVNPASFMSGWSDQFRIEDIAFVPNEHSFDYVSYKSM